MTPLIEDSRVVAPELEGVLKEFEDVFSTPTVLPFDRNHNHAIVLKKGTVPNRMGSYRYPHVQKNEIEKLVAEMLAVRMVRLNNSLFLNPYPFCKEKKTGVRSFVSIIGLTIKLQCLTFLYPM